MAALPSPTQVAGSHVAIYEAYYKQVDPKGVGRIGALEAAQFLKKSNLSDVILSKIWDMADPQSRGSLDKPGLFVALKLCALMQQGHDLNMANINMDLNPPKMGELPKISQKPPPKPAVPAQPLIASVSSGDWAIKPTERLKYDQLFDSLQPTNGYIPGNKVKGVLMRSELPRETLGKIWDLADMDKDGMLDRHEFVVAMHLVYKALEKYAIPSVLPPELMPPGKRKDVVITQQPTSATPIPGLQSMAAAPPPAIPPLPNVLIQPLAAPTAPIVPIAPIAPIAPMAPVVPVAPVAQKWVVSTEDQLAADDLFVQADMDMDGFVSGGEIKDVFLQSGLPQAVLADIWGLCDMNQSGKLTKEQFALAMWLIKQKLKGIDPPLNLTPEMIPPSMRKPVEGAVENNNVSGYSNPELDMISKDIAELARERRAMEQDIAQKEADIKIKNGEIKSLQSELDTLASTLKQLENQKGEAQKRLNDLKTQKAEIDKELSDVAKEIREEQEKVDKLRQQAEEQESVLHAQEDELNSKRQELEGLKQEEQQLEQQQTKSRDQLNELTKNLQDTQLQISQAKAKITHLEEQQRQMKDAIALYDSALAAGDVSIVPDTSLHFNPEIEEIDFNEDKSSKVNGVSEEAKDAFSNARASFDGFGDEDPFASSQVKDAFSASSSDPFGGSNQSQSTTGFASDPFAFRGSADAKRDPFDPFGDKRNDNKQSLTATSTTKDPFGDDPFANLHAPTRPESPSPALPPKKPKQPPPRPAPPRPSQGPTGPLRAAPVPPVPSPTPDFFGGGNDPFAAQDTSGSFGSAGGFANFANFDSKPEPVPSRTAPPKPTGRVLHTPTPSAPRMADFTEDPFKNYRYEDPFEIADPFADDDQKNANNISVPDNTTAKLDPFGYHDSFNSSKNTDRTFDSDFNTLPFTKNKSNSVFEADFSSAFTTDSNRNVKFDADFGNHVTSKTKNKDESPKGGSLFSRGKSKSNKNSNKAWNGNRLASTVDEEQQLAWAAEQSVLAEKERQRRQRQEEEELALALEISKLDKI